MASLAQKQFATARFRWSFRVDWVEIAVLLIAFVVQIPLVLNPDLGWLLTVCEKMLAGARLGKDVIELNPPLSVLMYMPAAYLGTLLPVPPHIFVIVMVLILAQSSTLLTLSALKPLISEPAAQKRAKLVLLVVLTLAPGVTFGQREHVAVLALLPFVALAANLALRNGLPVQPSLKLLIGLSGGFAMCIKPHFAVPVALSLIWAAVQSRSFRPLFGLACWIAAATVVIYYVAAILAYPSYFAMSPRWAMVAYLPLRMPISYYLNAVTLSSLGALGLMLSITCGRDPAKWASAMPWLIAALGGLFSYVMQGKDCSYMRLPAVTFGLLASLLTPVFLTSSLPSWERRKVMLLALAPAAWLLCPLNNYKELEEIIRTAAPSHPTMLLVGSDGGVGEPLVRKVDGVWASAILAPVFSAGAGFRIDDGSMPAKDIAFARQIIAFERSLVREGLQQRRPDVVLIDSLRFGRPYDWTAWARTDPAINRELDRHYRLLARRGRVDVWLRRQAPGV